MREKVLSDFIPKRKNNMWVEQYNTLLELCRKLFSGKYKRCRFYCNFKCGQFFYYIIVYLFSIVCLYQQSNCIQIHKKKQMQFQLGFLTLEDAKCIEYAKSKTEPKLHVLFFFFGFV